MGLNIVGFSLLDFFLFAFYVEWVKIFFLGGWQLEMMKGQGTD